MTSPWPVSDIAGIVLVSSRNDPLFRDPLSQFPTEARERVQESPRVRSGEPISRPHIQSPRRRTVSSHPQSARWAFALVVAAPAIVVLLVLARPVARLRDLTGVARVAQPGPSSGHLESFPIAISLSSELQPATRPQTPLTSVLSAPVRATAPVSRVPPAAPVDQAPSPASASPPAPSAFRGSLAVTSTPEGAQVYVNGIFFGTTPLTIVDLPVGSRVVRIERAGHERWSSLVRIVANEPTSVVADLPPSRIQ